MAKNVIKKKQRIAHNKTSVNQDYEMFPPGSDFLSHILEDMDNNYMFPPMQSNKSETDFLEFSEAQNHKKSHPSNVIPTPNQNLTSVPKSKKFGVSRKFPLMEKTKSVLKQLKHNRTVPKPRAHLAGLSESPVRKSQSYDSQKFKKTKTAASINNKYIMKNTGIQKEFTDKPQDKIDSKQHKPTTIQNSMLQRSSSVEQHSSSLKSASKKQVSSITKNNSEKSVLENSKTVDSSSDSDDYEKFIRKEKRDLPKKQKNSKKKPNSNKKVGKKRPLRVVKPLSESESDDEFPLSKSYPKRRKNLVEDKKSTSIENSESEMDMINDEPCHASSSESDDLTPLSLLKSNLQSSHDSYGSPSVKEFSNNDNSKQNGLSSHRNLSVASSVGFDQPNVFHKIAPLASQPSVFHEMPRSASLKGNGQTSVNAVVRSNQSSVSTAISNVQPSVSPKSPSSEPISCNTYGTSSMSVVGNGVYSTRNDLLNVSVKQEKLNGSVEQEKSNASIIVDLTDSDNECDHSFTVMPKIVMTSSQSENKLPIDCGKVDVDADEDSEIEMVDVIVGPKKLKSLGSNVGKLQIKTEVCQSPSSNKAEIQNTLSPSVKLQTSFTRIPEKNEAVFSTGICKVININESKDETLKQSNLKSIKEENSLEVKKEPGGGDDCEIIFDAVCNSNKSQNLPTVHACVNKTFKTEKDFKAVKETTTSNNTIKSRVEKVLLKQKDVVGSSILKNETNTNLELLAEKKVIDPVLHDPVLQLFYRLKNEFNTYTEIVQTEESVQSTFKMLEASQAEKVKALESQVRRILSTSPGSSKISLKALEELSSQTLLARAPACSSSNTSSDISIKDLKTFASMNIVPLSSIPAKDIKPNLAELQSSLKKEPGTSEEINNMSFGEKCIVCAKDASAACQQCAKVFFCSHECGKKYWNEGHKDTCTK